MNDMISTKTLMASSAIFYGIGGVVLSFLPQEILDFAGFGTELSFVLQLLGAFFLGFAILNWMVRTSLVGGIYNRGIALANFMQFFIGTSIFLKHFAKHTDITYFLFVGIIYSVFAISFGYILFNSPKEVS